MTAPRRRQIIRERNDPLAPISWVHRLPVHPGLLVAAAFAALLAFSEIRNVPAEWTPARGSVVSIRQRYDPVRKPPYRVLLAYRYRADGKRYVTRWETRERSGGADEMVRRHPVRSRLPIYYHPRSPGRSVPFAPPRLPFLVRVAEALGILFGLGWAMRDFRDGRPLAPSLRRRSA
jgi:hypothetical protein